MRSAVGKVLHDVYEAGVRSEGAADESEAENEGVLGHVEDLVGGVVVPVGGHVDERGRHEAERGHLDGAQERHHQVQPGHCGRKADCKRWNWMCDM